MDAPAAGHIKFCSRRPPMGREGLPPGEAIPVGGDKYGELEQDLEAIMDEAWHHGDSEENAGDPREE
eukprot:15430252-Alexandrium_andersonii.AAC.1